MEPFWGWAAKMASIFARESAMPPSCTLGVIRSMILTAGVFLKIASAITHLDRRERVKDKFHDATLATNPIDDNWVSPSLPRCPGVARTRWLDDGVVGRGSNGEGLLGEAMKEQPAGL